MTKNQLGLIVAMVCSPFGSIASCSNQADRCEETRTCGAPIAGATATAGAAARAGLGSAADGGNAWGGYAFAGNTAAVRDNRAGTSGSSEALGNTSGGLAGAGAGLPVAGAEAAEMAGTRNASNAVPSTAGAEGIAGKTSIPCNAACIGKLGYCDEITNACVECLTDAHCPSSMPACEAATHRCVGCTDARHCSGNTPVCSVARNICVACTMDVDCRAPKPACNLGNVCVECTSNANCTNQAKPVCLGATQSCVACATNSDCAGSVGKSVCDASSNVCVECVANADCKDATKRLCATAHNSCVECLESSDCAAKSATPVCDPKSNSCVGCLSSSDCKDLTKPLCNTVASSCVACLSNADCKSASASRCVASTYACAACAMDSDCTQIAGKSLCLLGTSGQPNACVQCTGKRYAACGKLADKELVCDSEAHACSVDRTAQSVGLCQSCVSDVECTAGKLCYAEQFNGNPVGRFCMWKQGDIANGAPAACFSTQARPFVKVETNAVSIDGEKATLCTLRSTTCTAYNQFSSVDCAPSGAPKDANCGLVAGIDSKCVETSAGSGSYRCSTVCGSNDDCKTGFACSTGVSPNVCQFQ